jgi:hypothetical protein
MLCSSPFSTTLSGINFHRGILEGLEYQKYSMVCDSHNVSKYLFSQLMSVGFRQRPGIGGADSAKATFMVDMGFPHHRFNKYLCILLYFRN